MRPSPQGVNVMLEALVGQDIREAGGTFLRNATAYYRGADGWLHEAAVNELRDQHYEFDDTGVRRVRGWLFERGATNLIFPSIALNTSWTQQRVTVAAGSVMSPRRLAEACFLNETTDNNTHYIFRVSSAFTAGVIVCVSAWVQGGAGRHRGRIGSSSDSGANRFYANFDLNSGTIDAPAITGIGVAYKSGIEAYPDNWFRVFVSGITNPAATTTVPELQILNDAGATSYAGEVGKGLHYWNAQVEVGCKSPSSAIVTTSATVTRPSDDLTFPFPDAVEDCTVYCEARPMGSADFPDASYSTTTILNIGGSTGGTWRFQMRHDAGHASRRPQSVLLAETGMGTQAVATDTSSGQPIGFRTPYMRQVARIRRDPAGIALDTRYDTGPVWRQLSYQAGDIPSSPPVGDWGTGVVRVGMYSVNSISGVWMRGFRIVRGLVSYEVASQGFYDAVGSAVGEFCHLIEMEFSSGTVRVCTGAQDIAWNDETWEAVGGLLEIGAVEETADGKGQGVDVQLSGVAQALLAVLLTAQYRGRRVTIWRAHLDQGTGQLIGDPFLKHRGLQLSPYTVEEEQTRGGGTVRIRTRLSGPLALTRVRGIQSNAVSHQQVFPGDLFFQHAASLGNVKVYWGTKAVGALGRGGTSSGPIFLPPAYGG